MAIKSFADDTTADIYAATNSKAARKIPQDVWKAARRKMSILNIANDTRDLSKVPGNFFESLEPDRPGFHSIRINDNYRLIFHFHKGDAYVVSVENYHGRKTS
jgi:proteic killer suppression protein